MPIPGNIEPGTVSGQQQQQLYRQSIDVPSTVPIKKRRFTLIPLASPSQEEKSSRSEDNDPKNIQESDVCYERLPDTDSKDSAFIGKSYVRKSGVKVKEEEVSSTNIELEQMAGDPKLELANAKNSEFKFPEGNEIATLRPADDVKNKMDLLSSENYTEPEVPESSISTPATKVKQEISREKAEGKCYNGSSTGLMNIELSLGPKQVVLPDSGSKRSDVFCHKHDDSDPSLLSLSLSNENLVRHDAIDIALDNANGEVCGSRSSWDLNKTMDVWDGSTISESSVCRLAGTGVSRLAGTGVSRQTNSCYDNESYLCSGGTAVLSSDKGKGILVKDKVNSSNALMLPRWNFRTDTSIGLSVAMPDRKLNASEEHSSFSNKSVSSIGSPNLNMHQVHLSDLNLNRTVKSEPVDDNVKLDGNIDTCSSSNVGVNLSPTKSDMLNTSLPEIVLKPSICLGLICHRPIKSEVVQLDNVGYCKPETTISRFVSRVVQHQESSASTSALPEPLMPQSSHVPVMQTCSEVTASGDFLNQFEHSLHRGESHHTIPNDERIMNMGSVSSSQVYDQSWPCMAGVSNLIDDNRFKLPPVKHPIESCHKSEVAVNADETIESCFVSEVAVNAEETIDSCFKSEVAVNAEETIESCPQSEGAVDAEETINISTEMLEGDSFESDCKLQENSTVDALVNMREYSCDEVDEELEDGEVPQHLAEDPITEGKEIQNMQCVEYDTQTVQPPALIGEPDIGSYDANGEEAVKENCGDPPGNPIKDSARVTYELENEVNYLHKSHKESDEADNNAATSDGRFDLSVMVNVEERNGEECSFSGPTDDRRCIETEPIGIATDNLLEEINSGEHEATLCKVEASLDGHAKDKDVHITGNKSRIINLSRGYVAPTPGKRNAIQNRLLPPRNEKERYLDIDGQLQSWGTRDEIAPDGSKKYAKDRFHEQTFRSSRPSFVTGIGKMSNRFGTFHREWHPGHKFASETSYGSLNDSVIRRRHTSSISDAQQEGNGYNTRKDGTSLGSDRRKAMNDEFPSQRNTSLRRLSPGDRDGPASREFKMLRRIPRNISPNRCTIKDGYSMVGFQNGRKFMRPQSDHIIGPVDRGPQAIYDEFDGPPMRGNRNFSTVQRKSYFQIRSKSPIRSRTRSPGPWSSPRRPSDGIQGFSKHQSPAIYRTGRNRSPDRACFRDEIVTRRRGSPSYAARHTNDFRDLGSEKDNVHPWSAYSNQRSPPPQVFSRSSRRMDVPDSREVADGEEYMNGPLDSGKFHQCHADGSIDGRRKFIKRREPVGSFRPSCSSDNDGFSFHLKDGSRPYQFYPDSDTVFGERISVREWEFDRGIKHKALLAARRMRDIEENENANYRPTERVWHDHGFNDSAVKRSRF